MKSAATAVLVFVLFPVGTFSQDRALQEQKAIEQVLQNQSAAWNRHDLEGFMAGYWNSPQLTFFSGTEISSGWQATLERYRRRYQGEGREMGTLVFSDLRTELVGPEAAFVRGVYTLTMSDGQTPHGIFTLIFRKLPDGWKIVHDHTSAAQ
jgi:beta-aspartyl-peptidase (threonine type)